MQRMGWAGAGAALVMGLTACGDDGGDGVETARFELRGTWATEFGEETISDTRWDGFCLQRVERFDNDANIAILEIDGGEGCGAGFSRVIWKDVVEGAFVYCTTTFNELTADDAAKSPTSAVNDDPATGCGGFPWSRLVKR